MVEVDFRGGMKFVGRGPSGHEVAMDATEANGGEDTAARPVEVLLCALGGCTGMDVVSILRKMRTEPASLRVEITDERAKDYPKALQRIHLVYFVKGRVPRANIDKAVELSLSTYCPIANSLSGVATITHEIRCEDD